MTKYIYLVFPDMFMGLWLHADSLDDIEITLDGDPIDDSFVAYELTNIHSTEEVEFMSMAKKIVIDADYDLLFSLFGSPNVNTSPTLLDTNVEWDLKVQITSIVNLCRWWTTERNRCE